MRMLRSHLGALDSVDHDRSRFRRAVAPPGRRNEPVIMVCREQHEFPPAVPRYLHRLAQRPMLKLAELALKLDRCRLRHAYLECATGITRNIRSFCCLERAPGQEPTPPAAASSSAHAAGSKRARQRAVK